MMILQVVSLVSGDGAYGGPVSVAKAQSEELARRGHRVHLLAGWDGYGRCDLPGVDVHLRRVRRALPTPGYSGLLSPRLLRDAWSLSAKADVVHVHLARDVTTLTVARMSAVRQALLITQTHGMVMPDGRRISALVDHVAARKVLLGAHVAAALTPAEQLGLRQVAGSDIHTEILRNGVTVGTLRRTTEPALGPVVLFCARLHQRKRVLAFAEMARLLVAEGTTARFAVAGPDGGDLAELKHFITSRGLSERLVYVGPVAPEIVGALLASAAVYVLPSDREPFPMTVLEAMAEGTPAVITSGCMIADELSAAGAQVTDGSPHDLALAVARILNDPAWAQSVGLAGREAIARNYSIGTVVDRLERLYSG